MNNDPKFLLSADFGCTRNTGIESQLPIYIHIYYIKTDEIHIWKCRQYSKKLIDKVRECFTGLTFRHYWTLYYANIRIYAYQAVMFVYDQAG